MDDYQYLQYVKDVTDRMWRQQRRLMCAYLESAQTQRLAREPKPYELTNEDILILMEMGIQP